MLTGVCINKIIKQILVTVFVMTISAAKGLINQNFVLLEFVLTEFDCTALLRQSYKLSQ